MSIGAQILDEHFLERRIYCEHYAEYNRQNVELSKINEEYFEKCEFKEKLPAPILFKDKEGCKCFAISSDRRVETGYYIGVDWLVDKVKAVYVQPKVNLNSDTQVDYLKMLFSALQHSEVFSYTNELFDIKWDKPEIQINQQQDMLTPLLVLQYLQVVKSIVHKGLKKSYYNVEQNLRSRVKGKVLVAKNIKQNLAKSGILNTSCAYDEFGYNGIENRILKKALVYVERYLPTFKGFGNKDVLNHTFNYIRPAFEKVSAEASLHECRHTKINPFYKEYTLAIDLAKLILRRFGYNIQNTSTAQISTPPFWIDMSKLFELYVLGLLKDGYKQKGTIDYQYETSGNKLDYLLNTDEFKMVIDAKYKLKYNKGGVGHDDVRQVSGYARLKQVYAKLGKTPRIDEPYVLIDCMIIYPEGELGPDERNYTIDLKKRVPIGEYVGVFKCGVKMPVVSLASTNHPSPKRK